MFYLFFIIVVMVIERFSPNNVNANLLHYTEKRFGIPHAAESKNPLPL